MRHTTIHMHNAQYTRAGVARACVRRGTVPELPEVETVVAGLREALAGALLQRVHIVDPRVVEAGSKHDFRRDYGTRLESVDRHGKYILWRFPTGTWIQHLRMTGKMLPAHSPQIPPHLQGRRSQRQLRFRLYFDRGEWVFYDVRRFGTISRVIDPHAYFAAKRLAPEMFAADPQAAATHFLARVRTANRPIKAVLLDQTAILGPGNIYADEALFRAGIHPLRVAKTLQPDQAQAVFAAVVQVMREALDKRGTSMSDYLDVNGQPGIFQQYLNVYGRAGLACKVCGTSIRTLVISGRTSHFCPLCQRPMRRRGR